MIFYDNVDFKYVLDIDYEYRNDCNNYGCYGEGVCRCGKIENVEIKPLRIDEYLEVADKLSHSNTDLEKAVDIMFLLRAFDEACFNTTICGGYYGEEIDNVSLNLNGSGVEEFNALSIKEGVDYCLIREYGYLNDKVKTTTDIDLKRVKIEDVIPPINMVLQGSQVAFYGKLYKHEYTMKKIDKVFPAPIVIESGGKYKIIDGRHKFQAAKNAGMKKINVIVLS